MPLDNDISPITSSQPFQAPPNSTLLLGAPMGLAYLASLSFDLILSTCPQLRKTASLSSPYLEQVVGTGVYGPAALATCLDLHECRGVFVLQSRSNPLSGHGVSFAQSLGDWISSCGFSKVIVVSGMDKTRRQDADLEIRSPLRYVAVSPGSSHQGRAETLQWHKLIPPHTTEHSAAAPADLVLPPGAGMTQALLDTLKTTDVSIFLMLYYTEAGDNYHQAHDLANAIDDLVGGRVFDFGGGTYFAVVGLGKGGDAKGGRWIVPKSWEALYGAVQSTSDVQAMF